MTMAAVVLAMAVQAAAPAPFQAVARDMMSRIDTPRQATVRTPEEWASLWKQHAGGEAPNVDFGSRMVVAVFLGTRTSGGFSVEFVGTQESSGVLTVKWRERRPERGDITAQVMTSPMQAVTIPKFAGEVRFEKVDK